MAKRGRVLQKIHLTAASLSNGKGLDCGRSAEDFSFGPVIGALPAISICRESNRDAEKHLEGPRVRFHQLGFPTRINLSKERKLPGRAGEEGEAVKLTRSASDSL